MRRCFVAGQNWAIYRNYNITIRADILFAFSIPRGNIHTKPRNEALLDFDNFRESLLRPLENFSEWICALRHLQSVVKGIQSDLDKVFNHASAHIWHSEETFEVDILGLCPVSEPPDTATLARAKFVNLVAEFVPYEQVVYEFAHPWIWLADLARNVFASEHLLYGQKWRNRDHVESARTMCIRREYGPNALYRQFL